MEKLKLMKTEYERYKEMLGVNIYYNHSAGAAQNFSEYKRKSYTQHINMVLAAKKSSELQLVHIFFDSSTCDRVERDVKVMALFGTYFQTLLSTSGDLGCPARPYRRNNGPLHWILNP